MGSKCGQKRDNSGLSGVEVGFSGVISGVQEGN